MSPWYRPPPWTSATPLSSLLPGVPGGRADRDIPPARPACPHGVDRHRLVKQFLNNVLVREWSC